LLQLLLLSVTPVFLLAILPLSFLYKYIQKYYMQSSRELHRLDSISRSPIYALFSESLGGMATIRAYKKQDEFVQNNFDLVSTSQEANYAVVIANRWLGIRLEFVGTCVVFIATFFAVIQRSDVDPGLAGLSITYALQLTGQLNWLVRMSTEVETNLISVERCTQYIRLEVENPPILEF